MKKEKCKQLGMSTFLTTSKRSIGPRNYLVIVAQNIS